MSWKKYLDSIFLQHLKKLNAEYCDDNSQFDSLQLEIKSILVKIGNVIQDDMKNSVSDKEFFSNKIIGCLSTIHDSKLYDYEKFHAYLCLSEIPISYLWKLDGDYWVEKIVDSNKEFNQANYCESGSIQSEYRHWKHANQAKNNNFLKWYSYHPWGTTSLNNIRKKKQG